jgi:predicted RNase H-like nuclease (RuvC/YqgF family)
MTTNGVERRLEEIAVAELEIKRRNKCKRRETSISDFKLALDTKDKIIRRLSAELTVQSVVRELNGRIIDLQNTQNEFWEQIHVLKKDMKRKGKDTEIKCWSDDGYSNQK